MNSEIEDTITEKRVWGFWATTGFGVVVMVVSVIIQFIIAFVFIIARVLTETGTDFSALDYWELMEAIDLGLLLSLSIVGSAIVCTALILLIVKVRRGAPVADYLGLKSFGVRATLLALGITLAYIVVNSLINMALDRPAESDSMVEAYATTVWPALFWMALVVFGPVFEEVLFRGFLFEGFRKSRVGVAGAIIITSVVWAGFHLQYGLFEIISLFAMGIILGIVRHKTGSLWVPIIMHAFNNLLAMILITV